MPEIKINLSTKQKVHNNKLISSLVIVFALILITTTTIGITYSNLLRELHNLEAINVELRLANHELGKNDEELNEKRQINEMLKSKQENVTQLTTGTILLSAAFQEVETAITPSSKLIGLKIDKDKIVMTGITENHTETAYILANLRRSDNFDGIRLVSTYKLPSDEQLFFEIETRWGGDKINEIK